MSAQGAAPEVRASGRQDQSGNEPTLQQHGAAGKLRPEPKIARVLAGLIAAPRTTRELELAPIFDHVGHSTASDLRRLGVNLLSERVKIRGFGGMPCWVARYSIPAEDHVFALELLHTMRSRRGRQ